MFKMNYDNTEYDFCKEEIISILENDKFGFLKKMITNKFKDFDLTKVVNEMKNDTEIGKKYIESFIEVKKSLKNKF